MMQDITEHQKTFIEGFKDGIARYDKDLPCRWVNHRDINDGFRHLTLYIPELMRQDMIQESQEYI